MTCSREKKMKSPKSTQFLISAHKSVSNFSLMNIENVIYTTNLKTVYGDEKHWLSQAAIFARAMIL